ncbi:hypothetical protein [Tepidibacter sp. Z1-5]|uniref:hypothetical protein n=1 Tax=Tepidibacter sp. Z1-5 TaxID=3134138 RepID=UPI0030BD3C6F
MKYRKNSKKLAFKKDKEGNTIWSFTCLDLDEFPLIDDFKIKIKYNGEYLGNHLYFINTQNEILASFPWWDHVDKDLINMNIENIPLGPINGAFDDLEQGWHIYIFEHNNYVYILEGEEPCCEEFEVWFKVNKEVYINEWIKKINDIKNINSIPLISFKCNKFISNIGN